MRKREKWMQTMMDSPSDFVSYPRAGKKVAKPDPVLRPVRQPALSTKPTETIRTQCSIPAFFTHRNTASTWAVGPAQTVPTYAKMHSSCQFITSSPSAFHAKELRQAPRNALFPHFRPRCRRAEHSITTICRCFRE